MNWILCVIIIILLGIAIFLISEEVILEKNVVFSMISFFILYILVGATLFWIDWFTISKCLILTSICSILIVILSWKKKKRNISITLIKTNLRVSYLSYVAILCISLLTRDILSTSAWAGSRC